jgi:two-component system OmpR family response regulator
LLYCRRQGQRDEYLVPTGISKIRPAASENCWRLVKPGILIVADDAATRATLARWLLQAGYAVELAESPRRAREIGSKAGVALAIVAPEGFGAPGLDLARELAGEVEQIIVVGETAGAAGSPDLRIAMLLNEQDVLAKVKSALRPASIPETPSAPQILRFEGYTIDAGARTCVDAKGQELTLTRAEFSLLLAFGQKPGRVLSRDELTHVVAGRGAEPDDRSVDVLISRLRRKIEPDPKTPRLIVTVPGEGYRFTAKPQAVVASAETSGAVALTAEPSEMKALATPARATGVQANAPGPPIDRGRSIRALPLLAVVAMLAVVAGITVVGWKTWSNRAAPQQSAEAAPPAAAPGPRLASKPPQPGISVEEQRATVFKRMVTVMQDDRFGWRTIERLAIESGVDENEAHEILAEHPGEVQLGKSKEGKLIARLSAR